MDVSTWISSVQKNIERFSGPCSSGGLDNAVVLIVHCSLNVFASFRKVELDNQSRIKNL